MTITRLTKNFTLEEFFVSDSYPELLDSIDLQKSEGKIKLLCESILQPIRNLGHPVTIISGIRSIELNEKVGGSKNSDHLYSMACDFTCDDLLITFIWAWYNNLPYRQLIFYPDQNFIHVSQNLPPKQYKHEAFVKYKKSKKHFPYTGHVIPTI